MLRLYVLAHCPIGNMNERKMSVIMKMNTSFCFFTCFVFVSSLLVEEYFGGKPNCSELFTLFNSFTASSSKQIFLRALCQTHNRNADSKGVTKACLLPEVSERKAQRRRRRCHVRKIILYSKTE